MKISSILLLLIIIVACSPAKRGTITYDKGGTINKGKGTSYCSNPPNKRYAKDLEIALKAEMDSLSYIPISNFETSFKRKIVKLTDYSSQGLDRDLLLYRICEMSINRGFTSEQTSELIKLAITAWDNKSEGKSDEIVNVTSINQTGGITANKVTIGKVQRHLDNKSKEALEKVVVEIAKKNNLLKNACFLLNYSGGEDTYAYANEIGEFLIEKGYTLGGTGNIISAELKHDVEIGFRMNCISIDVWPSQTK